MAVAALSLKMESSTCLARMPFTVTVPVSATFQMPIKDGRDEMMACHNAVCKTVDLSPVGEII